MMRSICYVLFGMLLSFQAAAQGNWVQKADCPGGGRFWSMAFFLNGKVYAGTGRTAFSGSPTRDFWEYDPATDAWTQKADFPAGLREGMDGFSVGNKGYAAFGTSFIQFEKTIHEYDPAANTWALKTSHPGIGFGYSHGFVIDSVYYIGPENGTNKLYAYNFRNDTWSEKAPFPGDDRRAQVAYSSGGKGYMGMGMHVFGGSRRNMFQYDPATDTWMQLADMPRASDQSTAFSAGGQGYVYNVGQNRSELYRYNIPTDEWVFDSNLPVRHANATGVSGGAKAYLVFGERSEPGMNVSSNRIHEFTPGFVSSLPQQEFQDVQLTQANGLLQLRFPAQAQALRARLLDLQGRELASWTAAPGAESLMAPLPKLTPSVYLLAVDTGTRHTVRKLFLR